MKKIALFYLLFLIFLSVGCERNTIGNQPPPEIPKGILIKEIPVNADIIFSSIRYVLNDAACLDENYELKNKFILDSDCNKVIYDAEAETIASLKQLFLMDFQSGEVIQITNTDCTYISGQVVDATTIMINAVCVSSPQI